MNKSLLAKVLRCVVLSLLFITIMPCNILAQGEKAYAYSESDGKKTYYYSIPEAMNGSRKGAIHMTRDWDVGAQINIVEGTTSIIYMDGFTIYKANDTESDPYLGGLFTTHPNSKLYLYGSTTSKEFMDSNGNKVISGGLLTGGYAHDGGAIYMRNNSKIYLTNVAISGNKGEYTGGGIHVGEDCEIWMDNGHIDHNYSGTNGGGIYSSSDGTRIHMSNNSSISYNDSHSISGGGAGVCFKKTWFSIEGDGTAKISNNTHHDSDGSGGGIYVCQNNFHTNNGLISGVIIDGNKASRGAGVCIGTSNIVLKDVTIANNTVKVDGDNTGGGGVYVATDVDVNLQGKVEIINNKRTDGADDDLLLDAFITKAYIRLKGLSSDSLIGIRTSTTGDRLVVKNISDSKLYSCFFLNQASSYHLGIESKDNELWQRNGTTSYTVKVNGKPVGKYAEGTKNVTIVDNNTDTSRVFVSWKENSLVKLTNDQLKSKTISFTMPAFNVNMEANYLPSVKELSLDIDGAITDGQKFPVKGSLNWTFNNIENSETVTLNWYKKQDDSFISCAENEVATSGGEYIFEVYADAKQDGVHVLSSSITKDNIKINYEGITVSEFSLSDEGTLNFKSDKILIGKDKIKYVDPIVVLVREGDSKRNVIKAITQVNNNTRKLIATSYNGYEYEVELNTIEIGTFNIDGVFDKEGEDGKVAENAKAYYQTSVGVSTTNSKIDLNGNTSADVVIMVLPNNDGDADTKPSKPELLDNESWTFGDTLSKKIKIEYNDYQKAYLLYYDKDDDGILKWNLKNVFEQQIVASKNSYKEVKAFAWVVENGNMSDVASKLYIIDNRIKFTSFISKVDVTIDNLVYGQSLPTVVKNVDVTLSGNKVALYKDVPIQSWNTNGEEVALNNKVYQAKIEITNTGDYDIEYLSSLHVEVNNNSNIYAYIKNEDGKAMLYIIFPELEGSTGDYDEDIPLSYTLNDIEIDDYTSEISYEEACKLNNEVSKLDLPNVILKSINNNDDSKEYFRIYKDDIDYRIITPFDLNNYNAQEIVIEGTINEPSYLEFNGLSNKFTLRIKVNSKQGYIPQDVLDNSSNKAITCEEYMKSKDWTWSESKKACVYKVSNTNSK